MTNPQQFATFQPWAIDTHCHLDHHDFEEDLTEVWEESRSDGIPYAVIPATDHASFQKALTIARTHNGIWCAAGLHPHEASRWQVEIPLLRQALVGDAAIAVGETGLDYHYHYSTNQEQLASFKTQVDLARSFESPLIIHVREAWVEVRQIMDEYDLSNLRMVFHAFSGDEEDGNWVLQRGGYLGIGGVLTFTKAERLRSLVKQYPKKRIVLETDAPYLTPEPYRGRRNLPAYVALVAEKLAEIWGMPAAEVRAITSLAAREFFTLPRGGSGKVIYRLRNNIYINLTNRCPNRCAFCLRNSREGIGGMVLWLDLEPTREEVIAELEKELSGVKPDEVVFCGFGEPTMRWEDCFNISLYLKDRGLKTRLDTNGLGALNNGRDICDEVKAVMDEVSVSLNAPDAEIYQKICQSRYKRAFEAVLTFIKNCVAGGIKTTVTAVDAIADEEMIKAIKELAVGLGANFRLRSWVR